MTEIKVTFSGLATAQADIAGATGRIQQQLDDLKRYLAPMVATWDGEAATFYRERQRTWDTSAADLAAVLAQIGQALGMANERYRTAEGSNRDLWR